MESAIAIAGVMIALGAFVWGLIAWRLGGVRVSVRAELVGAMGKGVETLRVSVHNRGRGRIEVSGLRLSVSDKGQLNLDRRYEVQESRLPMMLNGGASVAVSFKAVQILDSIAHHVSGGPWSARVEAVLGNGAVKSSDGALDFLGMHLRLGGSLPADALHSVEHDIHLVQEPHRKRRWRRR